MEQKCQWSLLIIIDVVSVLATTNQIIFGIRKTKLYLLQESIDKYREKKQTNQKRKYQRILFEAEILFYFIFCSGKFPYTRTYRWIRTKMIFFVVVVKSQYMLCVCVCI